MTVFAFDFDQSVRIRALDLVGRVVGRSERPGDVFEFRVIWWSDGQRRDEWLFEHELEAA